MLAEQALERLQGIGGDWHRGVVLTLPGQRGRARACWTEALTLLQKSDSAEAAEASTLFASIAPS